MSTRRILPLVLVLVLALAAGAASAQDIGFEGPSFAGASSTPSGSKPESKLWFHDGSWWGCLWSTASQSFTIHRLELPGETWTDTGVLVDARFNSRADCLVDGARLYIGSHRFNPAGGNAGHPLVVYRYTYDPVDGGYALDPGFPVQIADSSSETLILEKDSTDTLWATWMRDLRVHVAFTAGDDRSWVEFVLPWSTSNVDVDDVSSLVHFDGGHLGLMWSDQVSGSYYFTVHEDGTPPTVWSTPEPVLTGLADDHVNLKHASDGRVFAVLKTSTDEIRLAVRETSGTWNVHLVANSADGWTRPIGVLDDDSNTVSVFATSPILLGTIYRKQSPMDTIAFPAGIGDVVIRKASDPSHNDSTSTKQCVGGATGLVVVASQQPTERYWHHHDDLGGPQPIPPVARFDAAVRAGFEELEVRFHDLSSGAPDTFLWDFGDGHTSTEQHPLHAYDAPGAYTVELTVSNGLGADALVRPALVDVDVAPTQLVLTALDDSSVRQLSPDNNYGAEEFLRVRKDASSDYRSFVSFLVPPSENEIVSATLRLFVVDPSPVGGTVHATSTSWSEPFITWNTAPPLSGASLGSLGNVPNGTWVQLDVSSAVSTSGLVSFGLQSLSSNSAFYSSRQGQHPPELVLTLEAPPPGVIADFLCDRMVGRAPLTVNFTDTSSGSPTSWEWDFGDGGSSSAQHPVHVYTQAGVYDVSLTVSDGNTQDTLVVPGHVTVRPRTILPSAPPVKSVSQVSFTAGGGASPAPTLRWRADGSGRWTATVADDLEHASAVVRTAVEDSGWSIARTEVERTPTGVARLRHSLARGARTLALELSPREGGGVTVRLLAR